MTIKRFTKDKIFALYKSDDFLACGTTSEIAEIMNLKESPVEYYARPSYIKCRKEMVILNLEN